MVKKGDIQGPPPDAQAGISSSILCALEVQSKVEVVAQVSLVAPPHGT